MTGLPWADVQPLPTVNGDVKSVIDAVYSLQRAWKAAVSANSSAFQEARRRSLRRHAIETGIIERLYDLDWGVTEALVAEGLTSDVIARASDGSVSEDVLATVRSQYDALEYMVQVSREGRDVSIGLVKELHVILTRNQPTYTATGPGGVVFQATLHHGQWKTQNNHVTRPDGSRLEYTPAEHVAPQMERLVELYGTYATKDPLVRAAWLHHRFVRIHPFEDGNGRVARCLTLLGLLKCDLAPLVVDRRERERYLQCLDNANEADLRPLIRFFAELEIVALRSELERPVEAGELVATTSGAVSVLEASIDRLRTVRAAGKQDIALCSEELAAKIQAKVQRWLERVGNKFGDLLRDGVDSEARTSVRSGMPPTAEARYWHRQVVTAARSVDFFANLRDGVWWTRLFVTAIGQSLRYLVFIQKVGSGETGVLALTVYAEILSAQGGEDANGESEQIVVSAPTETVTWTYRDTAATRWENVERILDQTLAVATARFAEGLG